MGGAFKTNAAYRRHSLRAEVSVFVKNCWYVAAWEDEISEGKLYPISIIDDPVVIFRKPDRGLVALEDRCCHRFAPLSKGRLEEGGNLRCMYHGLKFSPDGTCIEIPGQDKIPPNARVRSYPVIGDRGWVWVWMGDPGRADPSLIPQVLGLGDPKYVMRTGSIDYKANYQLINDNLTDFSHVSYVHANSFGATDHWAVHRPVVKVIDRGIRVTRWNAANDSIKEDSAIKDLRGDRSIPTAMYQRYDFVAPGILIMYSAVHHRKNMPEDGVSPPVAEPLMENVTSQAVTPMTDGTSRYFFSWGPRRSDGGDAMADNMLAVAHKAFAEDREMIEAQQSIIDRTGTGRQMMTSADVGPVQMRAVLRKLCRAEQPDGALSSDETVPADSMS